MLRKPVSHTVLAFRVFLPVSGLALALQDSRSRPSASMTSALVMNFLRISLVLIFIWLVLGRCRNVTVARLFYRDDTRPRLPEHRGHPPPPWVDEVLLS